MRKTMLLSMLQFINELDALVPTTFYAGLVNDLISQIELELDYIGAYGDYTGVCNKRVDVQYTILVKALFATLTNIHTNTGVTLDD